MTATKWFGGVIVGLVAAIVMLIMLPVIQSTAATANWATVDGAANYLTTKGYIVEALAGIPAGRVPYADVAGDIMTSNAGVTFTAGTTTLNVTNLNVTGTITGATGRGATYVVAASDAPAHVKAQADYVCDGTADNVEIQAAIDACPAPSVVYTNMIEGGSRVLLTQGTFNIAATIMIDRPALELVGSGAAVTTLKAVNNLDDNIIEFDSTAYTDGLFQVHISDLNIDGDKDNQASGNGIYISGAHACYFERIQMLKVKEYSIYMTGVAEPCDYNTFNDLFLVTSGKDAFYATSSVYQTKISNLYVLLVPSGYYGINFQLGTEAVNIDRYTYDGGAPGVGSAATFDQLNYISITNSHFYGIESAKSGINIARCSYVTIENNVFKSWAVPNSSYAISAFAWTQGITDLKILNNTMSGNFSTSIWTGGGGINPAFTGLQIRNNRLVVNGGAYVFHDAAASTTGKQVSGNIGYIAPGEVRTASGSLTAGNANAIAFAWHNPEAQDILIKKVVIYVTTGGGTVGSHLDVGIADDAAGTNRGTEFFDDLLLNSVQVDDSWVAGSGGTQTVWVFCQDSASATDGWIIGQILDANAANLVGRYYIEYVGK